MKNLHTRDIKVILFGMTGFGNHAFKVLRTTAPVDLIGVFTPKRLKGAFPYYICPKLQDVVLKSGIKLYGGFNMRSLRTHRLLCKLSPDLIIVSTFDQIIPMNIIKVPKIGIVNIHPSLLPTYRGPTPTTWVLLHGLRETGITAHFITGRGIDSGRIITQERLRIYPSDTDGTLRKRLARLSEKVIKRAIFLAVSHKKSSFPKQIESEATYYPKRTLRDAEVNCDDPYGKIRNTIRAMSPYPLARLKYHGKEYFLKNVARVENKFVKRKPGKRHKWLILERPQGVLRFEVSRSRLIYE